MAEEKVKRSYTKRQHPDPLAEVEAELEKVNLRLAKLTQKKSDLEKKKQDILVSKRREKIDKALAEKSPEEIAALLGIEL